MGLIERIIGDDVTTMIHLRPVIPVEEFLAALGELGRGRATVEQIVTAFGMNADEQAELEALLQMIEDATLTYREVEDVVQLAARRRIYDTPTKARTRLSM